VTQVFGTRGLEITMVHLPVTDSITRT